MPHVISKAAAKFVFILLAAPTWWFVVVGAAAPRSSDNGVFLSVAAVFDGLPLYVGVVDNKDPFFFYSLAGALQFGPWAAQLLRLVWFLLTAAS